jgi:hypothetical protein
MHVFKDLQPYICTFEGCRDMLVTFPTRKSWSDHEFSIHRQRQFFACYQCRQELETEEIFRQHLEGVHSIRFNHKQFLATASTAKVKARSPVIDEQCPLCLKSGWTSARAFTTHVGRHMEGIALTSLPRNDESDSEGEDESQSTRSQPRLKASGSQNVPYSSIVPLSVSSSRSGSPDLSSLSSNYLRASRDDDPSLQPIPGPQAQPLNVRMPQDPPSQQPSVVPPNAAMANGNGSQNAAALAQFAAANGMSSPSAPTNGNGSSPGMANGSGMGQALSSGHTPAISHLIAEVQARHPEMPPDEVNRQATARLSQYQKHQAMQAAAGHSNAIQQAQIDAMHQAARNALHQAALIAAAAGGQQTPPRHAKETTHSSAQCTTGTRSAETEGATSNPRTTKPVRVNAAGSHVDSTPTRTSPNSTRALARRQWN